MKRATILLAALVVQAAQAADAPRLSQVRIAPTGAAVTAVVQFFYPGQGSVVLHAGIEARACRHGVGLLHVRPVDVAEADPVDVMLDGDSYADAIARALCARLTLTPTTTKENPA